MTGPRWHDGRRCQPKSKRLAPWVIRHGWWWERDAASGEEGVLCVTHHQGHVWHWHAENSIGVEAQGPEEAKAAADRWALDNGYIVEEAS